VSFGGDSCCFTLANQILNKSVYKKEDIQQAIDSTLEKTDDQLSIYVNKSLVVPNLCLVMAVMNKLGIESCEYYFANGCTSGLLIDTEFW